MASQHPGGGSTRSAVAAALGVLAVLAVLTSATAAGVSYRGADEPAAGPTSPPSSASATGSDEEDQAQERFFPDGQVLTGDRAANANIELPSVEAGWVAAPAEQIWFVARSGQGSLGLDAPFVYGSGYCEQEPGSYRAAVGFSKAGPGEGDDPRAVLEEDTDLWQSLLFRDYGEEPAQIDYEDLTLSDGTQAYTSSFEFVPRGERGPCSAERVELRTLTFDSGENVPVIYVVRDVAADGSDLPDGLSSDDADTLLAATRIQQED